ncbi:carbohydrate sulfotransferase 11-like protein [Leptotrombidium deliense]|uniref:Carbohydrate sulfotransferase n=1 Tax=Leptotrombidium deliense TaxID=299467 RepID=A0A443SR37_9ACAR|nr:carbohydrate sulfotransferase 11-like protein [Leptotrombidium deliense]
MKPNLIIEKAMNQMKLKVLICCVFITVIFFFATLTKRDNGFKRRLKTLTKIESREERRKRQIDTVCNASDSQIELTANVLASIRHHLNHFIFDDKHKLIYCFVPKVASTNWKRVLLSIDGGIQHFPESDPLSIKGNESQSRNVFKTLDQIEDSEEVLRRLKQYFKFVFVRNPLERLLSAFRNKFQFAYNDYFRERFGRKIIKQYRVNYTKASLENASDVTFQEFITYISDLNVSDYRSAFNEHWRPISDLCFPCLIRFDVIGKYETLEEDVFFILWKNHLFNTIRFPQRRESYSSKPTSELIANYYTQLPRDLLTKILTLYENDLNLFHYEVFFDK